MACCARGQESAASGLTDAAWKAPARFRRESIVEDDITPRFKQATSRASGRRRSHHATIEASRCLLPASGQQSPLFQHIEWLIPAFVILLNRAGNSE